MTISKSKEFLSQAYRIDQRINSKLEQIISLRELATKASSTLYDGGFSGNRNIQSMEAIIAKMIDLEKEINSDIDTLVDFKKELVSLIKKVKNPEYQTLLELRYLCFKAWEQIAVDMRYSIQNAYKLHEKALTAVASILQQSKVDGIRVSSCDSIKISGKGKIRAILNEIDPNKGKWLIFSEYFKQQSKVDGIRVSSCDNIKISRKGEIRAILNEINQNKGKWLIFSEYLKQQSKVDGIRVSSCDNIKISGRGENSPH